MTGLARITSWGAALAVALSSAAATVGADTQQARNADVVFLGEVHDNPAHHAVQSQWVEELRPEAIVFEMLTPKAVAAIPPEQPDPEALGVALQWEKSGWPDFDMYYPIFAAARGARIFGAAIAGEELRGLMTGDFGPVFAPGDARALGLDQALPVAQQETREALQARAHCDALPKDLLPGMVRVQRARDAALARAVVDALAQGLSPVVVITGNGHARRDWGAPAALARALPGTSIFSLGQGEDGVAPDGTFDVVIDAPAPVRGDPCALLR